MLDFNTDLLRKNEVQPTPLKIGMVPVDMDVTPMDNSKTQKEGIGWTYKKSDGYAPLMAYIGTEGYLVNTEQCEQFHSEIKTNMGVECLPYGKFVTNELFLELTVLAYNIFRMIGQKAIRQDNASAKRIVSIKRVPPSFKILFILPVMLRSTQGNCFFPSAAATPGLTVFLHLQASSVSPDFHGFRKIVIQRTD